MAILRAIPPKARHALAPRGLHVRRSSSYLPRPLLLLILLAAVLPSPAFAVTPDLVHDVLPLVKVRCVKCHGPGKSEGGLNLSTPAMVAKGGDSGAAVSGGQLDESLLWQRIAADEMPPDDPLKAEERGLVSAWIKAGSGSAGRRQYAPLGRSLGLRAAQVTASAAGASD